MKQTTHSLNDIIRKGLIQSKLTRGLICKTITYNKSFNVGKSLDQRLTYSNSKIVNKDIIKTPFLKVLIGRFSTAGALELIRILEWHSLETEEKINFKDFIQNLEFDVNDLSSLETGFLSGLQQSEKFKGYGGFRTKADLKITIEEFSKFYQIDLAVSVRYQFFLVVDAYENIKIDFSKNKDNFPDFEKTMTKQINFKLEKV